MREWKVGGGDEGRRRVKGMVAQALDSEGRWGCSLSWVIAEGWMNTVAKTQARVMMR
jgi:hypothetical protein